MYVTALGTAFSDQTVGGKGAMLSRLVQAGFAVPAGAVITTEAHSVMRRVAGVSELLPEADAKRAYRSAAWPDEIVAELDSVGATLSAADSGAVAVRSSAVHEDKTDDSQAGRFHSELNVRGRRAVREAVTNCWASAQRMAPASPMAVIMQRMLAPSWSGVAFSADPVRRDPSQILVEAVAGLADKLCAGETTPHRFAFDKATFALRRQAPVPALPQPGLPDMEKVARCALRLEQALGKPQDIEWAICSTGLYVLQSRPITTPTAVAARPLDLTALLSEM